MTLLNRDQILKAQDIKTKDVLVPEWGGSVRVRSMTLAERSEFARRVASDEDKVNTSAWLLSILAVDDNGGAALFKPEDVKELEKKNPQAIDSVVAAILEINAMDKKKVEDAGKNLPPIQS